MTREEKIRQARRLRAFGWTAPAIGRQLGVNESTIRNWYLGGVCADCSAPVEGSNGDKSKRCLPCDRTYKLAHRLWTREAVIDAIQRYAAANGKPPSARAWIRSNPNENYPAKSSCYRSSADRNAPFRDWADAIEAAGLPRPRRGVYVHTPEIRARQKEAQLRRRKRERQAA